MDAKLRVCVLGDADLTESLANAAANRRIRGRVLIVECWEPGVPVEGCHVLLLSNQYRPDIADILTRSVRYLWGPALWTYTVAPGQWAWRP